MITSHFRKFIGGGPCTKRDGGQQQSQSNGNR
jgi:hypothetical protein